VDKNNLT